MLKRVGKSVLLITNEYRGWNEVVLGSAQNLSVTWGKIGNFGLRKKVLAPSFLSMKKWQPRSFLFPKKFKPCLVLWKKVLAPSFVFLSWQELAMSFFLPESFCPVIHLFRKMFSLSFFVNKAAQKKSLVLRPRILKKEVRAGGFYFYFPQIFYIFPLENSVCLK